MGISRTAERLPESGDDRKGNPEESWGYMAPVVIVYVQRVHAAKREAEAVTGDKNGLKKEVVEKTHRTYGDRITKSVDIWSV